VLRPRVIACLLLSKGALVKTQRFADPVYVGDPINAVRIFNEKDTDELMVLDIDASAMGRAPDFALLGKLAAECRMPLCYGGGVAEVGHAERLIGLGIEKVAVSSKAISNPALVGALARAVGRQSIVAVLDVLRTNVNGRTQHALRSMNGKRAHQEDPLTIARLVEQSGAGEIVINSIDRDGTLSGYDIDFAEQVRNAVGVPLTVLGGAGSLAHMRELIARVGVVGVAAGSLFVFKGKFRAVLINYPTIQQRKALSEPTNDPRIRSDG
jgi:cyclase